MAHPAAAAEVERPPDLPDVAAAQRTARQVARLLNLGHAIDHMFLLIFATAVATIAAEFGFARWEDLMPYSVGAFVLFGLGSLPSGRLGDLWGRRRMMLIFFFGIGASALLAALTHNAWQLAAALTLLGAFASIYHPVGIPMLVQRAPNPGAVIGVNGLAGNLGIAVAALVTGFLVKWIGWRAAFAIPGLLAIGCGLLFARVCPHETEAPAKRNAQGAGGADAGAAGARVRGHDGGGGHRQPAVQLHHQRQRAVAGRALSRHRRRPGAARRDAGRESTPWPRWRRWWSAG